MSNMSYCRFQNTLGDLRDCIDAMNKDPGLHKLSSEEKRHAIWLIEKARAIAEAYEGINLRDDEQLKTLTEADIEDD